METGVPFNSTRAYRGGRLALRAVVFDFGFVLSGPPDTAAWAAMLRVTGLPEEQFQRLVWIDRQACDSGQITGIDFWQRFLCRAELPPNPAMVEELNRWDQRLWTVENPVMLAWQLALKQRDLLTAILSNMDYDVLASIEREFSWIDRFDVQVWSCQLGIVKPDPAIYRYTFDKLGIRPEEMLFIDDLRPNIEAARALGIQAIQFSSVEQLRQDLIAAGLDAELPLPAVE